ncbi:MAG: hypothetical protein K2X28_00435, partial [Alphaproteobacteria bacterium]|nr:hypothetical protein [Alphaproteobacteria bacterium]
MHNSLKVPFSYAILITTILSSLLWTSSPSRAAEKGRKDGTGTHAPSAQSSTCWQNFPKERIFSPHGSSSSDSYGKSRALKKESPHSSQKPPSSSYEKGRKDGTGTHVSAAQSSTRWQNSIQSAPESSSSDSYGKSTDLNFDSPYPEKWNQLSVRDYFGLLQDEIHPAPQLVVNWCKGMFSILTDVSLEKQINQITLSRIFSLLGQKSKQRAVKMALKDYFKAKPEFLKEWYSKALSCLNSKNPRDQFDQLHLSNIFYGHALLGQLMRPDFEMAWYAASLNRLKSQNPSDQFDQQALTNIFYGHALLKQKMRPDFETAWYAAALNRLKSPNPRDHFDQQHLSNIFYGHALLGQQMPPTFQEAWYAAALNRLKSPNPRDQFNQQELANIFYGHALLQKEIPQDFETAWYAAALNRLKSPNPRDHFDQ